MTDTALAQKALQSGPARALGKLGSRPKHHSSLQGIKMPLPKHCHFYKLFLHEKTFCLMKFQKLKDFKHCICKGHPFFRILRTQPQNPQRPKKRPPVGVVLFLGSCKRFAFSNVFQHCQLYHDELYPINTGNDQFSNRNLTKINFKCVKSLAS